MTDSSDNGVIFFSGTSSSAKVFWYFSQFWPVALGMLATDQVKETETEKVIRAGLSEYTWRGMMDSAIEKDGCGKRSN
jgi:hypothetical protein